jgi:hypothetical protein
MLNATFTAFYNQLAAAALARQATVDGDLLAAAARILAEEATGAERTAETQAVISQLHSLIF